MFNNLSRKDILMAKLTQARNSPTNISIVSTNDMFTIDSKTGWVVTNAVFYYDYDNFDFDDETNLVELSIKASDKDQLEDVCTLSVNVKKKNVDNTGKSLSEALPFAEHGENMWCTKNVLNFRNNFCKQHVLPRFELGIFMY